MCRIDLRYEVMQNIISALRNLRKFQVHQLTPRSIMNNENHSPKLLSLAEVGERTALSRSTLYREIEAGRLTALKIGKSVRVTDSELRRYIEALEVRG